MGMTPKTASKTAVFCRLSTDRQLLLANEVTEHGQNIHIDYANLPCIRVSNRKIDEFLPMSLCIVASGQKAQLALLAEMKVVSEADLKMIQCKIRNSARHFNIKINNTANNSPSIARIME
jgi:hypothetical protein